MPYIWMVVETESCVFVEKIVSIDMIIIIIEILQWTKVVQWNKFKISNITLEQKLWFAFQIKISPLSPSLLTLYVKNPKQYD